MIKFVQKIYVNCYNGMNLLDHIMFFKFVYASLKKLLETCL